MVGDLGSEFSFDVLNHAFRLIRDGARLIALQKNRFWQRDDGLALDVGPFVVALEYATEKEAGRRFEDHPRQDREIPVRRTSRESIARPIGPWIRLGIIYNFTLDTEPSTG